MLKALLTERNSIMMRRYKNCIYTLSICLILLCQAQGYSQSLPDTLIRKLETFKHNKDRINYLLTIIEKDANTDKTLANTYVTYIVNESKKEELLLEYYKGKYWSIKFRLEGKYTSGELDIFNKEMETILHLLRQKNVDIFWHARVLALRAEILYFLEDKDLALKLNQDAFQILNTQDLNTQKQLQLLGDIYKVKGNIYFSTDLDSTNYYYDKALIAYQIDESTNNEHIIRILKNKSIIAIYKKEYGSLDSFYLEALNLCASDDSIKRAGIYLEWGIALATYVSLHRNFDLISRSNEKLYLALAITDLLNPNLDLEGLYYQLGANYQNLAQHQQFLSDNFPLDVALDSTTFFYKKSITAAIHNNNKRQLDTIYKAIAQICSFISISRCDTMLYEMGEAYLDINNNKERISEEKNEIEQILIQLQQQEKENRMRFFIIILLLSLLLLGILSAIIFQRQRFKSIRKNLNSKLEALRAQMNPHFISNSLNAIDSLVVQRKNDIASEYIVDFSRLCRMTLDSSRQPYITLKRELEILKHFLSLEQLRLPNRLHVKWDIDENLDLESYFIPPLIMQPFVENAIWHGILNKENRAPGLLSIGVRYKAPFIECMIEDDGVGRNKAKSIREDSILEWQSWGMQIANERIESLQKIKNSKLEIMDLYGQDGEGVGTKVIISLPLISNPI